METEREYPRWIHAEGHASVVVESADEENTVLAQWAAETTPTLAAPGAIVAGNKISFAQPVAFSDGSRASEFVALATAPKKGGWPKGKPRGNRQQVVN